MKTIYAEMGEHSNGDVYAKSLHELDWAHESSLKDKYVTAVVKLVFDGSNLVSAEQVKKLPHGKRRGL